MADNQDLTRIAERLRQWREARSLTLQALARRSGVAASTIQKVETQQMVPTIAVLLKICRGLERRASELFHESDEIVEVVHLRPADRRSYGSPPHLHGERLNGSLFDPLLEVWRVDVPPGVGMGQEAIRFEGEQCLVIERGALCARVRDEEYQLSAGDSLHYKASLPHTWQNRGSEPCRLLIVSSRSPGELGPVGGAEPSG